MDIVSINPLKKYIRRSFSFDSYMYILIYRGLEVKHSFLRFNVCALVKEKSLPVINKLESLGISGTKNVAGGPFFSSFKSAFM